MAWALALPATASAQVLEPAPDLPRLDEISRIVASDDPIDPGEPFDLTVETGYWCGESFCVIRTTSFRYYPKVTTTYLTDPGGGIFTVPVHPQPNGQPTAQTDTVKIDPDDLTGGGAQGSEVSFEVGATALGSGPGAASFGVLIGGSFSVGVDSVSYLTLQAGVRWMGPTGGDPFFPSSPRPSFQDRRHTMVSLGVSRYLWGSVGVSVSGVAAWEVVRGSDYYLKRAYGAAAGVRYRRPLLGKGLVLGLDVLYSDLSEFQRIDSRWRLALSPSVTLNLLG
jgi:hypothetical protein